jgi:hypothetical protein
MVMELIFPRGKDTIHNDFTNSVESADIPPIEGIQIVRYGEHHPKMGRTQKFRRHCWMVLMDRQERSIDATARRAGHYR